VALCLAWFGRRLARGGVRLPLVTLYLAPVHLVLIAGCWGRDAGVLRALYWLAAGSLVLSTVAFAAPPRPQAGRRLLADGALLAAAHAALFWIAIRRAGIVDVLWNTLQGGADRE
jgi:hypothetical protein